MAELLDDLRAETASLETLLDGLRPPDWEQLTPAEGWAVRDQVSHLAWFDDAACTAATDPAAFQALLADLFDTGTSVDDLAVRERGRSPAELRAWFGTSRERLIGTLAPIEPRRRLPWYGVEMSATSFVTARLMETWAHGQDIADATGATREPTDRLRHVARIGFMALPYSFTVRGLPVPERPVRAELALPGGGEWTAGPPDAADVVRGPMLDFCLAVTQRIHVTDTALRITGETAQAWMRIAQAFAGPPGRGRDPQSG
ncbi:TIGR03084 family metal-binding protein [Nonomuraea glycinis]|uniref:TIGR03084 family metal-binding protein n=1 Tax=Nonomuraea glycinis TaxID=2047744 RepID=UPI0033B370FB